MKKVNVYIDGFNLYHSLDNKIKRDRWQSYLKWVDLKKLVISYLKEDEEINQIYFFSAVPKWGEENILRHKNYSKALYYTGIKIINGNFSRITRSYNEKMKVIKFLLKLKIEDEEINKYLPKLLTYETFEEKRTDVNIAVKILEDAFKGTYDNAIILSGDSDIIPSIESVKRNFSQKKFYSLLIAGTKGKAIINICDENYIIGYNKFLNNLLPKEIITNNGLKISIPPEYGFPNEKLI